MDLAGYQRRALRAQAHDLQPIAFVGKDGIGEGVVQSVSEALSAHELIKVRFVDLKRERRDAAQELADAVDAAVAGVVGHVAILYRPHPDVARRRIELPTRD
jgi:RNA-binding protein